MKRIWRIVTLLSFLALLGLMGTSEYNAYPSPGSLLIKGILLLGLFALSAWKGGLFE